MIELIRRYICWIEKTWNLSPPALYTDRLGKGISLWIPTYLLTTFVLLFSTDSSGKSQIFLFLGSVFICAVPIVLGVCFVLGMVNYEKEIGWKFVNFNWYGLVIFWSVLVMYFIFLLCVSYFKVLVSPLVNN